MAVRSYDLMNIKYKDPKSNNWWLAYQLKNELVAVSYWLAELLNLGHAAHVQWEVATFQ